MTTARQPLTDGLLESVLLDRLSAAPSSLEREIMRAVEATPQRRGWVASLGGVSRASLVLVAAVLLMTALAVAAVGSALLRPTPLPMPTYHHNGSLLVLVDGNPLAVDPMTGTAIPPTVLRLPHEYTYDLPAESMSWSPDGRRIALAGPSAVTIVEVVTGTATELKPCGNGCAVAWSPDGATLAITRLGHLDLVDLTGARPPLDPITVPGGGGPPSWFPNSDRVRFFRGDALWTVNREGTGLTEIVGPQAAVSAWSPDGTTVAWISWAESSQPGELDLTLKVGPANTSSVTASLEIGSCACLGWQPGLTWSPDGQWVAFNSLGGASDDIADGLYVVRADGSGLRRVGGSGWGNPAWQPIP
jgi:Tol biopolymer transport system component